MITPNRMANIGLMTLAITCFALVIVSISPQAHAAPLALPPRPTPSPTLGPPQEPDNTPAYDASIQLRVSPARPELWTIVQWQDAFGNWHDVEGWQGILDDVVGGEGQQVWWVAKSDQGTGPFRWLVYERKEGRLLAQSESFHLPQSSGQTVRIKLALAR